LIRAAVLSSGPILFPRDFTLQSRPAAMTLEVDQLSLEEIIRHKLKDYFRRTEGVDVDNLYTLVIERVERPLIELTLKKTHGNQIRAAQILGINRNTLRKKIADLHIEIRKENS
jgi:two-component system nitrogen regulation response regulator GlnG